MTAPQRWSKELRKAPYTPSPWGARFHSLTVDEALGGGAAGPGKTVCLTWDALPQIIVEQQRWTNPEHPYPIAKGESQGWALFLRRTVPMLGQTIRNAKLWFPKVDPGVEWNQNDLMFTFSSGYRFQFGHCKDKDDWWQYQGNAYTRVLFDELTQFLLEQYNQIGARVRVDDPVLSQMLGVRGMANPVMDMDGMAGLALDENPHWVRDLFVNPDLRGTNAEGLDPTQGNIRLTRIMTMSDGTEEKWTRVFLKARLSDNPNPAFARQYERLLRTRPMHIQRALLDGDWFITAGSFFANEWGDECEIKPFPLPLDWPVFRSLDWGFKAPGHVLWFTMDPDENLIVIAEMKFQGKEAARVARDILAMEENLGLKKPKEKRSRLTGPADTQLWEERGNSSKGMAQEMAEQGVYWVQADKKDRMRNAQRISVRLRDDGTGTRALSFFRGRCPLVVKVVKQIPTDPKNPNEPMEGGDDHPYDALAYGTAFASKGRKGLPKRKIDIYHDEDDPPPPRASRGSYGYGSY